MNNSSPSALEGIRVLDFTRVLAGPLCTMNLADLGADVIKIENPKGGDDTRNWGQEKNPQNPYFLSINRNKRSLSLNLKYKEAQNIIRELVTRSHIVVENFKVGQMTEFGLGYDALSKINPALVYCSITGFGQTGSYQKRPGYDLAIQAMSGLMSITGPQNGLPYKVGVAVSDIFTSLYANTAILAALRHAEQTGQGQYIDMALLDSQLAALVNVTSNVLMTKQDARPVGNEHVDIVPYQSFNAADNRAFVVCVGNDSQFNSLCKLIDRPAWMDDERFATNPARVEHRDSLIPLLDEIFLTRSVDEWVTLLLEAGIPAGPINSVQQALNDPHVHERGMIQSMNLADGSNWDFVASPMKLSETPAQVQMPPPQLGEHTHQILTELLQMDSATIQDLQNKGVI